MVNDTTARASQARQASIDRALGRAHRQAAAGVAGAAGDDLHRRGHQRDVERPQPHQRRALPRHPRPHRRGHMLTCVLDVADAPPRPEPATEH